MPTLEDRTLLPEFGLNGELSVISKLRRGQYLVLLNGWKGRTRRGERVLVSRVMTPAQIEATSAPRMGSRSMFWRSRKAAAALRRETLS